MQTVTSRTILVTGALGALGQAVVARFLANGDTVIGVHRPGAAPAPRPGIEWVGVDLTKRDAVEDLFRKYEDIAAVVHCAGGFRWGLIDQLPDSGFRYLLSANFESSFYVATAAIPAMKKRKDGVILFISSKATLSPTAGMSAYAATKAAVNALVTTLGEELKNDGVRINAILPSVIDTPTNRKDMPKADPSKWVSTEELADLLFDLTLPKTKSITGALIPVSGRV